MGTAANAAEKYIFILKWIGNPYWQAIKQGIEDEGKAKGINLQIMTPINDQAKEEHLNLCQAAISQKPAIIVLGAATTAIGLQCFREAQKQGIKVADIDATVSVEEAKKSGVNLSFTIGADNVGIGTRAAEFIAFMKLTPTPKVLVLEGVAGSPPSMDRVAGFKKQLALDLPHSRIVGSQSAEWDRLRALNIAADTLTRSPDLDAVFAANDVMALGAVEAIRAAGKTKQVVVVGVDGVPDARKAILAGRMTASITQLPYLIGKQSVDLAIDSVHGKCNGKTERAPLLVLTKSVLEAKKEPLLQYVR
ncbi:MAG TPA: substrate-binding domain-containing protein [Planktothrix sp.]|jgi:D-allose transport system substrate-binding protein